MSSPEATGQINSSLCTSMQPKNCASRKENDSFLRSCMMKNLKKPRGKTMYGYGYCWVYHHSSNRRVAVSQGKSSPQWLGDHGCWICGEVTMRKRLHGCWCFYFFLVHDRTSNHRGRSDFYRLQVLSLISIHATAQTMESPEQSPRLFGS